MDLRARDPWLLSLSHNSSSSTKSFILEYIFCMSNPSWRHVKRTFIFLVLSSINSNWRNSIKFLSFSKFQWHNTENYYTISITFKICYWSFFWIFHDGVSWKMFQWWMSNGKTLLFNFWIPLFISKLKLYCNLIADCKLFIIACI